MKVKELVERLKQCSSEAEVSLLILEDYYKGEGNYREYEIDDVLCGKTEVKFVSNWAEEEEG